MADLSYYNDQELPNATFDWTNAGEDFSTGWTFTVRLARTTARATTVLLKTTGITSTATSVTVAWSTTDWSGLEAATTGTSYFVYLYARRTADSKDIEFRPGQPVTLTLYAAPGTSAVSPSSYPITVTAASVTVADTGGLYAGSNVETVLAEVGRELNAAQLAPGLRWAFFGDSIINGSGAALTAYSVMPETVYMVGSTVARTDSIEAGTAGDTSALLAARVASTFSSYPDVQASVILIGTNDAGSTPVAASVFAANMTTIIGLCRKVGPVVVCTVPPKSSTATAAQRNAITAYNLWIKTFAPLLGCEVADVFSALVDTTTGYLAAANDSGDGIHPSTVGHGLAAVQIAKAIKRVLGRSVANSMVTSVIETTALLTTDPLATSAGTKPTSWFEQPGGTGTAPTYSIVSDTSSTLPSGRWAQMDFDGTASGGTRRLAAALNSNWAVGDVIAVFGYVQIEDVSGSWVTNVAAGTEGVTVTIANQSGTNIANSQQFFRCPGIPSTTSGIYDIGPVWSPVTVPSGTTSMSLWLNVTVPTGQRIKARFGNFGVLNLTALGLNGSIGAWAAAPINT